MADACPMCSRKVSRSAEVKRLLNDRAEIIQYATRTMKVSEHAIALLREIGMEYAADELAEELAGAAPKPGTLVERAMPWVQPANRWLEAALVELNHVEWVERRHEHQAPVKAGTKRRNAQCNPQEPKA